MEQLYIIVNLLENLSNSINEGFLKINQNLSLIENGMLYANIQISEIKQELYKIK